VAKSKSEKKTVGQPNAVARYFRETRGELRKVTWPTRRESWRLTGIVLAVTIATAAFLWFFDTIFGGSLQFLIERMIGL
jgi:preprotein translocase subunit SecE